MNAWIFGLLLALAHLPAHADAPPDPFALPETPAAVPATSARPSDEAIRAAVRATLNDMPDSPMRSSGGALSGAPYREFERKFAFAAKPHCMGPDPLKHQPHSIQTRNWVFGATGIFALPFWGAAILRGKCSWTR